MAEAAPAPETAPEVKLPESAPARNDDEVMAAIASLAPSNGHGGDGLSPTTGTNGTGQDVPVAVIAAVAAEAGISGPRWIAEAVAVTPEESALALDREMEEASAVKAVAENVGSEIAEAPPVEAAGPGQRSH